MRPEDSHYKFNYARNETNKSNEKPKETNEKTWKINASYDAHFANGASQFKYSSYWKASSFSKSTRTEYNCATSL